VKKDAGTLLKMVWEQQEW